MPDPICVRRAKRLNTFRKLPRSSHVFHRGVKQPLKKGVEASPKARNWRNCRPHGS